MRPIYFCALAGAMAILTQCAPSPHSEYGEYDTDYESPGYGAYEGGDYDYDWVGPGWYWGVYIDNENDFHGHQRHHHHNQQKSNWKGQNKGMRGPTTNTQSTSKGMSRGTTTTTTQGRSTGAGSRGGTSRGGGGHGSGGGGGRHH